VTDGKRSIYTELESRLKGFPVDEFVRAYAKAYLEADLETIYKLQELILGPKVEGEDDPDFNGPDSSITAPKKPRPHFELRCGCIAGARRLCPLTSVFSHRTKSPC
jgi:hypothetical protein